jgi:hypothetical protein
LRATAVRDVVPRIESFGRGSRQSLIQAHTHRDTRTAVVISGLWYFGYGPKNEQALVKALPPGAFYTEPAANRTLRGRVQKGRP